MTTNTDVATETEPSTTQRRWLGALGIGIVGAISDILATPQAAQAGLASPCCSLATNTKCSATACRNCGCSSCYHFTCPAGYYKQYWWCTSGTRLIGCGECTKSTSTCWSGPFACSIWWDDGACPC